MAQTKQSKSDYTKLTDYILTIYKECGWNKDSINWPMLTSQIKNQVKELSCTYNQIRYTLWYMKNICNVEWLNEDSNGSAISLVPYYIDKAKEFCIERKRLKGLIEEFDFDEDEDTFVSNNKQRIRIDLEF